MFKVRTPVRSLVLRAARICALCNSPGRSGSKEGLRKFQSRAGGTRVPPAFPFMKILAALICIGAASAQPVRIFDSVTASAALADGIELHSGSAVVRITALRDDVVRVRLGPAGTLPEDASWAVLPAARTARVSVTPFNDDAAAGFVTGKLRVAVQKSSLRIVISDLKGN